MSISIQRAYDKVKEDDAFRVLVDRLWPRGMSKVDLRIDLWMKQIAPSDELRRWFGHYPQKWDEFKRRYFEELDDKDDLLRGLKRLAAEGAITQVYAEKNGRYNNASALKENLERISI